MPSTITHSSSIDAQDSNPNQAKGLRTNSHIDHRQVRNIMRAVKFAELQGRPLDTFVTINFGQTGCSLDATSKVFERLRDNHFTKWLRDIAKREGQPDWLPAYYIWAIENKPANQNVHWLVNLPQALKHSFEIKLAHWMEKLAGPLDPSQKVIHIQPADSPVGAAKYSCKGINPRYARHFRINPIPQGIVTGKRAGISKALGPEARRRLTISHIPASTGANAGDQKAPKTAYRP
jgi:hypothetical protein